MSKPRLRDGEARLRGQSNLLYEVGAFLPAADALHDATALTAAIRAVLDLADRRGVVNRWEIRNLIAAHIDLEES